MTRHTKLEVAKRLAKSFAYATNTQNERLRRVVAHLDPIAPF